ncbi:MAG: hypothetical protein AAGK78_03780, partial [Planctomycetota bacterium]
AVQTRTSLDGEPLETSQRIYVATGSRVHHTGSGPQRRALMEPVVATIEMKLATGLSLYPMGPTGRLGRAIEVAYDGETATITLPKLPPTAATFGYMLQPSE